eukprot:sb/3463124/
MINNPTLPAALRFIDDAIGAIYAALPQDTLLCLYSGCSGYWKKPQFNGSDEAMKELMKNIVRQTHTAMPQNEHIELAQKRHGKRFNHEEKMRKKLARSSHSNAIKAKKLHGLKAKLYNKKRHSEKIQMKKTLKMHEEKQTKTRDSEPVQEGAVPAYLLDRETESRAKVLSNMVKQKRKEKAGKWAVPIPKVKQMGEDEVFKVMQTGKRKKKAWKRMVTKVTYVGEDFTRKPPKYERFIRPMALRFKKAHVTHPELKATFCLPMIGVKKNPNSPMYTQLGVITKGTVIEVNVSELGLVTTGGKVVWGKYAQVTNHPENDGCINAVLLVFVRGTIGGIYLSVPEEAGVDEVELFIRDVVLREEMKEQCSKFFIFFSCQCEPHNALILEIVLDTLDTLRRTPTMSPYLAPSLARPGMPLPVGYILAPLQQSHVDHIVHHWKLSEGKEGRSETQLRIMANSGIKERPSVGVFVDGKPDLPVAWCLMYQAGGLGPIYVMSEHRGKALARLMVREIHMRVEDVHGVPPFAMIADSNVASHGLFCSEGWHYVNCTQLYLPLSGCSPMSSPDQRLSLLRRGGSTDLPSDPSQAYTLLHTHCVQVILVPDWLITSHVT